MRFHPPANVIVSVDDGGMVEYWVPDLDEHEGHLAPTRPTVDWGFKTDTDLYEFKKVGAMCSG